MPSPTVFNPGTKQWVHGAAIANPSGGTILDTQARATTNSILAALRAAGVLAGGTAMPGSGRQFDGVRQSLLAAITAPTGGTPDAEMRTAVGGILTALQNAGIIAGATKAPSLTSLTLGNTSHQLADGPALSPVLDLVTGSNIDTNCRTALISAITAMRSASLLAS